MIGDKLIYYTAYKPISDYIISLIRSENLPNKKLCIAISGESGCGKTSLAYSLKIDIETFSQYKGILLHQDDYFLLPPKTNHEARVGDINKVGISEVNLKLMDEHLKKFKGNEPSIQKPLVNYLENEIGDERVDFQNIDFCIIEGTYAALLENPDYTIFMKMDYKKSKIQREKRARDLLNEFNEQVLEIEHQIIKQHAEKADLIIGNQLQLITN